VEDFLTKLAIKMGKLIKGGDPNLNNVAVQVINDWQRGKLPFFVPPPRVLYEDDDEAEDAMEEGEEEEDLLAKIQLAEQQEGEMDGDVEAGLEGVLVPPPADVMPNRKKRGREGEEDEEGEDATTTAVKKMRDEGDEEEGEGEVATSGAVKSKKRGREGGNDDEVSAAVVVWQC
jgi:nuclear GTP-binding protein